MSAPILAFVKHQASAPTRRQEDSPFIALMREIERRRPRTANMLEAIGRRCLATLGDERAVAKDSGGVVKLRGEEW